MSKNVHSYVIFLNLLKMFEMNIIWIYINTKYAPIFRTVIVRIWCSVIMRINHYSAKCFKMSTGPNSHGTHGEHLSMHLLSILTPGTKVRIISSKYRRFLSVRYPSQWKHFRIIRIFIFNNDQLPVLCMFFFHGLFTASLCSVLWQSGLRLNFINWIACVIACWILLSTCSCMTNVAVF